MSTPTVVYRLFSADDELLYIGMTSAPEKRFARHACKAEWWPQVARIATEQHPSRAAAHRAEAAAILAEQPRFNNHHRRPVKSAVVQGGVVSRPVNASPAPTPAGPSLAGGNPVSSIAAALRGGGSTCGHLVLPPSSPRQSPGVGDGATAAPGSTRTGASDHPARGSRTPANAGSPVPFDHLAAIGLSPEEAADNCYTLTVAQAADLRAVLRGWR